MIGSCDSRRDWPASSCRSACSRRWRRCRHALRRRDVRGRRGRHPGQLLWHDHWTWRIGRRPRSANVGAARRFNAMTGVTSIVGSVMVTAFLVDMLSLFADRRERHQRDRAGHRQLRRRQHAGVSAAAALAVILALAAPAQPRDSKRSCSRKPRRALRSTSPRLRRGGRRTSPTSRFSTSSVSAGQQARMAR